MIPFYFSLKPFQGFYKLGCGIKHDYHPLKISSASSRLIPKAVDIIFTACPSDNTPFLYCDRMVIRLGVCAPFKGFPAISSASFLPLFHQRPLLRLLWGKLTHLQSSSHPCRPSSRPSQAHRRLSFPVSSLPDHRHPED